jgi:hypothetical protein
MFAEANRQLAAGVAADVSPPPLSGVLLVPRLSNSLSGESHSQRLARLMPCHFAEWHLRRLLTAAYWNWRVLLWWFADQVIATLPPPDDGVCYLVVDSTFKDKTGQKHPLAKTGRLNEYAPYIFGLHIVVQMLQWGNYCIPVDFEIARRKGHPHYRSDAAGCLWMNQAGVERIGPIPNGLVSDTLAMSPSF